MSKYITPSEIGKHIEKLQGNQSDTAFSASMKITRQGMLGIRNGLRIPNVRTRAKLGLELVYKVVPITDELEKPVTNGIEANKPKKATKK